MWAVLNNDNTITTTYYLRPKWYNTDGTELTDEELNTHSVYKVVDSPPSINYVTHRLQRNPQDDWTFDSENNVILVTFTIIEKSLEEAKQSGKNRARGAAEQTKTGGTQYPGDTWIFPTDDKHSNRLKIYQAFLEANPSDTIRYENIDGHWMDLTLEVVSTMLEEIFSLYKDAAIWEENKHIEIDSAESIEELENIVYTDFSRL
jgi:hypothetical protein